MDRLSAGVIGLLCGLVMAVAWGFVTLRGVGGCYVGYESAVSMVGCAVAKWGFWILLLAPSLIGVLFGSELLLALLSRLWGTHRTPGVH